MSDKVIELGADKARAEQIEETVRSMFGAKRLGCDLIVDGRAVPRIHIHDLGDEIEFVLDNRFSYCFPRGAAHLAASFAANAMAIGAGYPYLGADSKDRPFAPQVHLITLE